jgi:hypothetical protein
MLGLQNVAIRFDVVTVVMADGARPTSPQIELLRNFWTEASIRKRRWEYHYYD